MSGGTGRGDANNDSSGAGMIPSEEGAAGARVGATAVAAERVRVSNHSSRVSN